jgi:PAS domain S-box-containing protein
VARLDAKALEAFSSLSSFFSDPVFLLAVDGEVLSANNAALRLQLAPNTRLHTAAQDSAKLRAYLECCARVSAPLPGRFTLHTGTAWRTRCARWPTGSNGDPLLVLQLTPAQSAPSQFAALNQRIEALNAEIRRRRAAEEAARRSEEKMRLLADTIPQLAWMAQPDGHIFWYNRRWYEYTGTTQRQMEGWGWQSVHDPQILPKVLAQWQASIASGEPFDMVFPLRGADGAFRPFLTRVNPLRDSEGSIVYWFGTNTDISDMKRMEEALRDADRRKDEFLATLAHELRNPLAPIVNSLQILKIPRLDAPTAQQTRGIMERQVQQLVRLVDDLLDVSRVVRGKVELRRQPLELATAVARAVETVQPLVELKRHRLDLLLPEESMLVDGDPVRLAQVIGNLLTNSAKYTEPGGHIVLAATREGGEAILRIRDDGIGIAPDMLRQVFDLFVQADQDASRSQGGLGIGLTLAKNLVELHGGRIDAFSAGLGQGSEFIIRLPVLPESYDAPAAAERAARVAPLLGHRVLVVDDNRDAAESLAMLLRLQGHDVRVRYDGTSALETASTYRPAIIFLDIGLPGMDGFDVARRLRETPGLENTVLAALTGWGQAEARRRSTDAGFHHHLVKPPDPDALGELLAALPPSSA